MWAYVAQVKVEKMRPQLGDKVEIDCHFIPVFGDTAEKIGQLRLIPTRPWRRTEVLEMIEIEPLPSF